MHQSESLKPYNKQKSPQTAHNELDTVKVLSKVHLEAIKIEFNLEALTII